MANTALDREAVDEAVSRGSDLLKQGKLEEAQRAFRAALHLDGENPRILALLGLTHFRAGQFPQARPIYEELVERAPTDASHRLNLGLVYLKLGESDKAIGSLEASRALDPSQGRAVSYLGLAYARAGRYAEAYRSFLLAGQNDLASEIEINLTGSERAAIHAQLQRSGVAPEAPRTKPPKQPPRRTPEHGVGHVLPPVEGTPQVSMPAIRVDRDALNEQLPKARPANEFEQSAAIVIDRPPVFSSVAIPIDVDEPARKQESASIPIEMSSSIAIPIDDVDDKPRPSSGLSEVEIALGRLDHAAGTATPINEIKAPQMTDSLQFVLPEREAVPTPALGQSIISRAVEVASPSAAAAAPGSKVGWGSTPPVPLSQLATEQLVRPEDGDSAFEVTATGALVIRVEDRIHTRLDGIHITGGNLEFEPAMRRSRGHQTDDKFNYGASQLHTVSGEGYLIAVPGERKFTAVTLDDDILYLREDLVFAFESTLRWENGNVPGLRGKLPVVQFRGDGSVALRSAQSLVRVKLPAQGVLFVDATRLAGWIGRVIPRAVVPPKHGPMGDVCVECTGEGVVLIDPGAAAPAMPGERARNPSGPVGSAVKASPPPPPGGAQETSSPAIELDVVKSADWLSDDDREELAGDDKSDEI